LGLSHLLLRHISIITVTSNNKSTDNLEHKKFYVLLWFILDETDSFIVFKESFRSFLLGYSHARVKPFLRGNLRGNAVRFNLNILVHVCFESSKNNNKPELISRLKYQIKLKIKNYFT
jgi:hypothetical protein